jgi:hypothetical protein
LATFKGEHECDNDWDRRIDDNFTVSERGDEIFLEESFYLLLKHIILWNNALSFYKYVFMISEVSHWIIDNLKLLHNLHMIKVC